MFLAIDAGNTNTVLGCFENGALTRKWRISTHPLCTSDEFRAKLAALLDLDGVKPGMFGPTASGGVASSVIVSSVVPPFTPILKAAFPGTPFHIIDHRSPFSFTIMAEPQAQVGADRLVNAEAAVRDYGAPVIIVDSGTATTVCAVSCDKQYLGGAIMPGMELAIEALARKTAKLFTVELVAPAQAIGTNTQDALRSGLMLGYASMIDGMVRRFKAELGGSQPVRVVATGGISALLHGLTTELEHFDADLTLRGIAYVHDALRER